MTERRRTGKERALLKREAFLLYRRAGYSEEDAANRAKRDVDYLLATTGEPERAALHLLQHHAFK